MKFALASDGTSVEARKTGQRARCQGCREEVYAVCGDERGWHWRHQNDSQCDGGDSEPETPWHKNWKAQVPLKNREVVVPKRGRSKRADIKADTGTVIELQHSEISPFEMNDRESFYGREMFWIFDSDHRQREIQRSSLGANMRWNGLEQWEVSFRDRVVGVGRVSRPSLVDLDDVVCRVVPHVTNCGRNFQAVVMSAEEVRRAVQNTCEHYDSVVAWFLKDVATDWIKRKGNENRAGISCRGQSIKEYCPHVGDLQKYHPGWLAQKTEKNSRNYYEDGY